MLKVFYGMLSLMMKKRTALKNVLKGVVEDQRIHKDAAFAKWRLFNSMLKFVERNQPL